MFLRPQRFTDDDNEETLERVKRKGKSTIEECFGFVESRLRGGKWAVGEQMTAVDAFLLVFWRWGVASSFEMGKYERYRALMGKLVEKESVKEVLKAEKIQPML